MPIVEAMYFNLPCIVSNIEVVKEVTNNAAIYFSPLNVDELAQCMKMVDQYKLNSNQKIMIEEMFSNTNTVEKYIKLINSIIIDVH